MKHLILTISILIGLLVSFYIGKSIGESHCTKDFEAACLQADFIRYLISNFDGETEMFNIGAEIENSYEEYFQELDNGNFGTQAIRSIRDFDAYHWE